MVFGAWPDSLWEGEPIEPCHVHYATEMTLSMLHTCYIHLSTAACAPAKDTSFAKVVHLVPWPFFLR